MNQIVPWNSLLVRDILFGYSVAIQIDSHNDPDTFPRWHRC